jgi:hypothetical protein
MKLWEYTREELIGGAEIRSDVTVAPEIEMPWESDKIERIISMPNYGIEFPLYLNVITTQKKSL